MYSTSNINLKKELSHNWRGVGEGVLLMWYQTSDHNYILLKTSLPLLDMIT